MRKGLLFWSGIALSILIAGLLLFLIGHVPEERNIARAIPHPTFDSPFIFVSAEGDSFNPVSYTHLTLPTNREV